MTSSTLSVEGFRDLLDRLGGDLSCWPAPERQAATALIEQSPEAQQMLAEARRLDAGLSRPPSAPKGLADRIVKTALGKDDGQD
ncbi:MAG: hypothetical protein NVV74_22325 [Magnetospirillum sp.]|nr:hypothetical protein [Magnetospirillum sp.]